MLWDKYRNQILTWLIIIAFIPISLDLTVLHVAAPTLAKDFNASGVEILWIIDVYGLITGALVVPMGTLADRIGCRNLYLIGTVAFLLSSILAAFAPNPMTLIIARGLMGAAGAMVVPTTIALIRHLNPGPRELAVAYGWWAAGGSGCAAAGPVIGGFFVTHFFSGSIFLINVAILGVLLPFLYFGLKVDDKKSKGSWPIGQGVVMGVGMLFFVYFLKHLGKPETSSWILWGSGLIGIALLAWFYRELKTSANPMLDLSLFKIPTVFWGMIVELAVLGCMSGVEFTLAQELQFVYLLTPIAAGLFMIPLMASSCVFSPLTAPMLSRMNVGALMALCLLMSAIGLFGLGVINVISHRWISGILLALIGASTGIGLTAVSTALMNFAPEDKSGSIGSLEGIGYDLGASLGVAFLGTFLSHVYSSHFIAPSGLPSELVQQASQSISDTSEFAATLQAPLSEEVLAAGQAAYVSAHAAVLVTSSAVFAILAVIVYFKLRKYKAV